jgi:hypothetical protein
MIHTARFHHSPPEPIPAMVLDVHQHQTKLAITLIAMDQFGMNLAEGAEFNIALDEGDGTGQHFIGMGSAIRHADEGERSDTDIVEIGDFRDREVVLVAEPLGEGADDTSFVLERETRLKIERNVTDTDNRCHKEL